MKFKEIKPHSYILIVAILIAVVTRFYQLDQIPTSLFGDEIDVGYHAWSLWTTGRDYMGNLLPIYIKSLAEYRAPLLMYFSAPFVGILGPSTFSVRLAPALFGILGIVAIYFFTRVLLAKEKSSRIKASLSALLLAGSFWHIHYSRAAFESTLLLLLLLLGFASLVGFLRTNNTRIAWGIPLLALCFYTYSTASLFVPLLTISTLLIYRPQLKMARKILPQLFVTAVLFLPIGYQLLFGQAAGRFKLISIFNDQQLTDSVIISRTLPWINPQLDRIFHNRPLALLDQFKDNYYAAFSPAFLFRQGDPQPRHSVPGFGELPSIYILLLLLGGAYLIRYWSKASQMLMAWLLLAPIPSALTMEGSNHATRLILMLPPLVMISALGASFLFELLRPKLAWGFTFIWLMVLAVQLMAYGYQYIAHYRTETARAWHYGYQDVLPAISKFDTKGKRIFVNNTHEPSLLRFVFYTGLSPVDFQNQFRGDVPTENILPGFDGFQFGDKVYFGRARNIDDLVNLLEPGDLYFAVQGEEVPGDWDWSQTPPGELTSLKSFKDIRQQPYMYLMTR